MEPFNNHNTGMIGNIFNLASNKNQVNRSTNTVQRNLYTETIDQLIASAEQQIATTQNLIYQEPSFDQKIKEQEEFLKQQEFLRQQQQKIIADLTLRIELIVNYEGDWKKIVKSGRLAYSAQQCQSAWQSLVNCLCSEVEENFQWPSTGVVILNLVVEKHQKEFASHKKIPFNDDFWKLVAKKINALILPYEVSFQKCERQWYYNRVLDQINKSKSLPEVPYSENFTLASNGIKGDEIIEIIVKEMNKHSQVVDWKKVEELIFLLAGVVVDGQQLQEEWTTNQCFKKMSGKVREALRNLFLEKSPTIDKEDSECEVEPPAKRQKSEINSDIDFFQITPISNKDVDDWINKYQ